jgi:uncharacterized membrane protein HdeD (DUF308 family)
MTGILTRNWWAFALRGIVAIALGLLAFVVPGPTLVALIAVFAAYAIFDGVIAIVAGASSPGRPRWWIIFGGIAGIAIGVLTIISPGTTAIALVLLIGVWAIVTGVGEVVSAYTMRAVIDREWLLALSGVISVGFGVLLLVAPGSGVLAVLWLIGYYAIFAGVMYLAMAFRLRRLANRADAPAAGTASAHS